MYTKFTKTKRSRMFSKIVAGNEHLRRGHLPEDFKIMCLPVPSGIVLENPGQTTDHDKQVIMMA